MSGAFDFDHLVELCRRTHEETRSSSVRAVDRSLVVRNWLFGWYLVEYEQNGVDRAKYGAQLLSRVADRFRQAGIKGASATRLKLYRQFYRPCKPIGPTLSDQLLLPAFDVETREICPTPSVEAFLTSPGGRRQRYDVMFRDFVLRFGNTEPRREIVSGFLEFRGALQTVGLVKGFQWIDGSFVEDIETVARRAPADIDVVTFIHLPDDKDQATLHQHSPRLFGPTAAIEDFGVDAYFVQLNAAAPESLVARSAYWYSLWSYRRDGRWKGYLQIDLAPADDRAAKVQLDAMLNERGQP